TGCNSARGTASRKTAQPHASEGTGVHHNVVSAEGPSPPHSGRGRSETGAGGVETGNCCGSCGGGCLPFYPNSRPGWTTHSLAPNGGGNNGAHLSCRR